MISMSKVIENIEKVNNRIDNSGLLLDTLAQPLTNSYQRDLKTFEKRARAKYLSRAIILKLIDLNSPLKDSYWRTWHCANIILQDGRKMTSRYCNNRWCLVCNRIRTAKLIKGYMPQIKKMNEKWLITLTVPNVPAEELKGKIDDMILEFIKVINVFVRRRNLRLNGIRKLECTYNEKLKTYHPHLHLLVDSREAGEALVDEWLKRYPEADRRGQDIRPADESSLLELFKYTTKLTTESKIKRVNGKAVMQVNAVALDTIFQALWGRRTFQPMGWVHKVSEDVEEIESQEVAGIAESVDVWTWEQEVGDWVNSAGELLTGCQAGQIYEVRFIDSG